MVAPLDILNTTCDFEFKSLISKSVLAEKLNVPELVNKYPKTEEFANAI